MAQVTITMSIPDNEVANVQAAILKMLPIPDENEDGTPDMNFQSWIVWCTKNYWRNIYRQGKKKIAMEAAGTDDSQTVIT